MGLDCVRNSFYTDDDEAGSPVLLSHLEGSGQAGCLPFMGGDIGSGKLREQCGFSRAEVQCQGMCFCGKLLEPSLPLELPLSKRLPRARATLSFPSR